MHIFKDTNFDFLRWRWHAVVLSWIIILAGVAVIMTKGLPRGIEFAGGTAVITQFDNDVSVQQVRAALEQTFGGQNVVIQSYGDPALHQVYSRVPQSGEETADAISATKDKVTAALRAANLGNFTIVGTEIVSPTVGRELTTKGIQATVFSLVILLGYIAFRYQLSFGVGAVVATLHDLLVTVAFLAFFQYDLSLNVIAAILTVTGYSTNDTIVIFDRVRENLRSMRRESLHQVINTSINQTLGRTVLTAGLTLLSAVSLFLFGGEVLRGFAFTMIVGIITGTYSSVFVAAATVTFWAGAAPTRAMAPGSTAAVTATQQPTRKARPQRKVKAS